MVYLIKTSVSTQIFQEIRKLRNYDKKAIETAKKGELTIRVDNPKSIGDMVRIGLDMPIFSESFVEHLKRKGISEFQPSKVNLLHEVRILNYYYLEPTQILKPLPQNRIDRKTLDINNVFLHDTQVTSDSIYGISNTYDLLCGEKIKNLVEDGGFKNIEFEQINYVPFDEANNPIFFYSVDHGWANKYFWLNTHSKTEDLFHPEIQSVFSRYSGTTVADAHGSTFAETYFSARVINFFRSIGSNAIFHRINTDSSIKNAELYYIELKSKIPRSEEPIFQISISNKQKNFRLYGNLSRWDGQNPFGIENTGFILINHQIKKLMEAECFENLEFSRMRYLVK